MSVPGVPGPPTGRRAKCADLSLVLIVRLARAHDDFPDANPSPFDVLTAAGWPRKVVERKFMRLIRSGHLTGTRHAVHARLAVSRPSTYVEMMSAALSRTFDTEILYGDQVEQFVATRPGPPPTEITVETLRRAFDAIQNARRPARPDAPLLGHLWGRPRPLTPPAFRFDPHQPLIRPRTAHIRAAAHRFEGVWIDAMPAEAILTSPYVLAALASPVLTAERAPRAMFRVPACTALRARVELGRGWPGARTVTYTRHPLADRLRVHAGLFPKRAPLRTRGYSMSISFDTSEVNYDLLRILYGTDVQPSNGSMNPT